MATAFASEMSALMRNSIHGRGGFAVTGLTPAERDHPSTTERCFRTSNDKAGFNKSRQLLEKMGALLL
jgi:hypothetical protein